MSQVSIDSNQTITITQEDILHQIKLSCKTPEIVEQIITRREIASAATQAGIEVTVAELQKASDQMRVLNKLTNAQATWKWLEKYNLSLDDFEEIVNLTLVSKKLADHLFADQVEPYYYQHELDYAAAVIYEIVLDDEDEAIELYYEIQEGEITFFEAAQQYIEDIELRRKGGYRGQVHRTEMSPEVSAAIFALNTPQFLKPIISSKGVHLIKVEEIIKPELDHKLRNKIMVDLFSEWLKQQAEKINAVSNLPEN